MERLDLQEILETPYLWDRRDKDEATWKCEIHYAGSNRTRPFDAIETLPVLNERDPFNGYTTSV